MKYGYSNVGTVLEGPEGLRGRDVFCLFPHQDIYQVPTTAVHLLPEGLPPERAVLAANAETALNAVWDGGAAPGDRIVVVGAGVVGLLIAWICDRIPGTDVTIVDVDPARAIAAEALGVSFDTQVGESATADLVVHASGHPAGLVSALSAAGSEATVLEVSWYGTRAVEVPLGEAFHSLRLNIQSSQVGHLPADRTARWDFARRMSKALELLREPSLDALITGESSFEDLPSIMSRIVRDGAGVLCHRIRYPSTA